MGFVIKESLKSTIISLGGAMLGALAIVLATRAFPQDEYGLQQSLSRNTTLAVYFLALGFEYGLLVLGQRFLPGSPKRGAFLRFSAIVPFLFFLLCCIPIFAFKDQILAAIGSEDRAYIERYYFAYPVICFFYLILFWLSGYVRSIERSTFAFFVNEIVLRVIVLALVMLYWSGFVTFDQYVWIFAGSFLIPITMMFWSSRKHPGFTFSVQEKLTYKDKKYIVDFSVFHMMIVFASVLAFQIDGFLFLFLSDGGLTNIAVFSVCIYAVSILRTPLRVLGQNAIPTFTRHYDEGDFPKLKSLYQRSSLNMQMLSTLLALLLLINIPSIQVLANDWKSGYEALSAVIPIMLLGVYVELSCGLNFEILGVSRHYRLSFYIALVYMIFIVVFYSFFVKSHGLVGAAWAFTLTMILFSLMRSLIVNRLFKMWPWVPGTMKVLTVGIISCIAFLIPRFENVFVDIGLRSIVCAGIYLSLCYFWKIGDDMHRIADLIFGRLRNIRKG